MPSHKKKDRGRKLEQARKRRAKRLQRPRKDDESLVFDAPPGVEKMSEVLLKFIEPYRADCRTNEQLDKLLSVAILAWNAAIVDGRRREEMLQQFLSALPAQDQDFGRNFAEELIRRKEALFADNCRFMVSYELSDEGQLNVMSTVA